MSHLAVDPVPVTIVKSPEELTSLAVEFGAWSTWTVPQIGQSSGPVPPILARRPTRDEARILIPALSAGALSSTVTATGSVATPAAGALIAGVVVGPGTFQVNWSVEITTVAATVPDNMRIAVNGGVTTYSTSINGTAIGSYPNQLPATVITTGASQTLGVYAIGAEATGTYKATLVVTQLSGAPNATTGVVLAHRPDYVANPANPQGAIIPASLLPLQLVYRSQQPLYAVGIGGPATILTLDQAQAASQATAEEVPEDIPEEYQEEGQGGTGPGYYP